MAGKKDKSESKVEVAKRQSRYLRGTIAEVLASDASHLEHDDAQLLKFHGTYQQDDRDVRKQRRAQGLDKAYSFMIRVAIPAGVLTAEQYLRLDGIAEKFGFPSLRITTRQGIQFHGVLKGNLKATIAAINDELITTLSACGDVERNVMACPAPLDDEAHVMLRRIARQIALELRPASRAYHEIWLDGEKRVSTQPEEPFYGEQYLPRKFKTGIALDSDNCVDVYSLDAGFVAIVEGGRLCGFNVLVGGGMGMTHNKADTHARLAEPFGFIKPGDAVQTVRTVAAIFRDHGNRTDRRHARLKYLLAEWGMDRFRDEFRRRTALELSPWRKLPRLPVQDHLGRNMQGNGKHFYGLFVENGRIKDTAGCRLKTGLRAIVEAHQPGVVLTPHQNLLFTDLEEDALGKIEQMLGDHGVATVGELSAARRFSMACPALPTCGLALSEAERLMPSVIEQLEEELASRGLGDEPITIRMTGCPNGCARPYTADLSFVGKGPDNYNVYVGGRLAGDRVVDLYAADVKPADFIKVLKPLIESWSTQRRAGEGLGDYYQRLVDHDRPRRMITGSEEPTEKLISLKVL